MKRVFAYFFVFFASVALIACDSGRASKDAATTGKKIYVLTDREKVILRVLLVDEIDVSAAGGEVSSSELVQKILGEYVVTTSANLQAEYERNEVAADQKFRKKLLLVSGTVKSIDRSVGENYYIALRGGSNPYITPKAAMADGHTDFLAQLQKGKQVRLACQGNGMLIGSAMLSNCEPLLNYAAQKANAFVSNLSIGDAIAAGDRSTLLVAIYSVAFASSLQDSSTCFALPLDGNKCRAEIMAFSEKKEKKAAAVSAAVEKMRLDKKILTDGNETTKAPVGK